MTKQPQKKSSDLGLSRREFVSAAAAVAAFTSVPKRVLGGAGTDSANNRLNIAGIGVGGRGANDIDGVSSQNIVALCDTDLKRASGTLRKHSKAKVYRDFREMLEKEQKNIDAVVIGAPDHEWDSEKMRSSNCPEADNYITKFYRAGFDLV